MKSVEESAVLALDGSDKELFPFLPYILQDLWEIGSDPDVIIEAIERNIDRWSPLELLDLGCGKGAVSVRVAKKLRCRCHGIDAIQEFIMEARNRAVDYGVEDLCRFEVGDIRIKIEAAARYDIVVLGSIGPVLGDCHTTLTRLSKVLKPNGIIIYDDCYIPSVAPYRQVTAGIREAATSIWAVSVRTGSGTTYPLLRPWARGRGVDRRGYNTRRRRRDARLCVLQRYPRADLQTLPCLVTARKQNFHAAVAGTQKSG